MTYNTRKYCPQFTRARLRDARARTRRQNGLIRHGARLHRGGEPLGDLRLVRRDRGPCYRGASAACPRVGHGGRGAGGDEVVRRPCDPERTRRRPLGYAASSERPLRTRAIRRRGEAGAPGPRPCQWPGALVRPAVRSARLPSRTRPIKPDARRRCGRPLLGRVEASRAPPARSASTRAAVAAHEPTVGISGRRS